jgi:hypothetical protein
LREQTRQVRGELEREREAAEDVGEDGDVGERGGTVDEEGDEEGRDVEGEMGEEKE